MMHYFAHKNDLFPRPEGKDYQLAGHESIERDWHSTGCKKSTSPAVFCKMLSELLQKGKLK